MEGKEDFNGDKREQKTRGKPLEADLSNATLYTICI